MLTSHRRWGDFQIEAEELAARWEALDPLTGPDAVRAFYALYGESTRAPPRWGDKTPGYVKHMREIQEYLPEARFIHLIRDGRDVALSVLKQEFGPETIEAAAEKWRSRVLRGRAQQPYLGFYMEVKFEDLVVDTEGAAAADLRVHRARLRPGDARLPRDAPRSGCRRRRGRCRAPRAARTQSAESATAEPREDLRAAEPRPDRRLARRRWPRRTRPPTRRSPATCSPTSATSARPPRRTGRGGPRAAQRAAAAAARCGARSRSPATRPGVREPAEDRAAAGPVPDRRRALRDRRCCG